MDHLELLSDVSGRKPGRGAGAGAGGGASLLGVLILAQGEQILDKFK